MRSQVAFTAVEDCHQRHVALDAGRKVQDGECAEAIGSLASGEGVGDDCVLPVGTAGAVAAMLISSSIWTRAE